jgi:uncharacterized circularly permuted ATP-grasp superfamily protein
MTTPQTIEDYRVPQGCCDELLDDDGSPRPHAAPLMAALHRLGADALREVGTRRDTIFMQQGITFEVAGIDGERRDRQFPSTSSRGCSPPPTGRRSSAGSPSGSGR